MKRRAAFCLAMLCPSLSLLAPNVRADDQGWMNNSLSLKASPSVSLKFTQETRYDELTLADAYLNNWSGGLAWSLGPKIYVSVAYLRETTRKSTANLQENRYTLEAGWRTPLAKTLNFDIRIRNEIRIFEDDLAEDHLRLRLRLRLVQSLTLSSLSLKPFLAVEPFANCRQGQVNSHRIYLGVAFPLSKQLDWTVNYIRQDSSGKDPLHIFNTGFELKF